MRRGEELPPELTLTGCFASTGTLATALWGGGRCCSCFTGEVAWEGPRQDWLQGPHSQPSCHPVQGSHASYEAGVDAEAQREEVLAHARSSSL